jgi:hypothetical protein
MECDSLYDISVRWDRGVAHDPIVYISFTILTVQMEMDLAHLSPHNLEGLGTRLGNAPQNNMYYTICAHARL